jgi:hypothetical protein
VEPFTLQPERRGPARQRAAGPYPAEMEGPVVVTPRKTSVLRSVRAELRALGKEPSPLGAVALTIAARLDGGEDPGSAMAAMAKELRATMVELGRTAAVVADPVDELKRRRDERRRSG